MSKVKELTLGLEYEMVRPVDHMHEIVHSNHFGLREDHSIQDNTGRVVATGTEVVTPIYNVPVRWSGNEPSFSNLPGSAVTALIGCANKVNSSCGLHVHLGNPVMDELTPWNPDQIVDRPGGHMSRWTKLQVLSWLTVGCHLEASGLHKTVPTSRLQDSNCARIVDRYNSRELASNDPIGTVVSRKYDNLKRYCWLNLIETKRQKSPNENRIGYASSEGLGTVEVRLLGEIADAHYAKIWCEFWLTIAAYIASFPPHKVLLAIIASRNVRQLTNDLRAFATLHETTARTSGVRSTAVAQRHPLPRTWADELRNGTYA